MLFLFCKVGCVFLGICMRSIVSLHISLRVKARERVLFFRLLSSSLKIYFKLRHMNNENLIVVWPPEGYVDPLWYSACQRGKFKHKPLLTAPV